MYQAWVQLYPHFNKDTFIPFKDFCDGSARPESKKSAEEILAEAEAIKNQIQGGSCKVVNGHDLTDGNEVAVLYGRKK